MDFTALEQKILSSSPFQHLLQSLRSGTENIIVKGISGSLISFVLAFLLEETHRQILYIAPDKEQAERVRDDLETLLGSAQVTFFSDNISQIETLHNLALKKESVIVSYGEAVLQSTPSPEDFQREVIELHVNCTYKFDDFKKTLAVNGFEKKDFVEVCGDFAVRGGIVDVFPYVGNNPIRIEFFGDTVDSIREFDVISQRSIRELSGVNIVPNVLATDSESGTGESQAYSASIFDFLAQDSIIFLDEPEMIRNELEKQEGRFINADVLFERSLQHINITHRIFESSQACIDFNAYPQPAFNTSTKALCDDMIKLSQEGYAIAILCGTQDQAQRLGELLDDMMAEQFPPANYHLLTESLHKGFVFPEARLAVYTDHEIFGRYKRTRRRGEKRFKGISLKELQAIQHGDYVVHVDHGIGKFAGLEKIKIRGNEQECVKLIYEDNDVLFVNLNYVNRIQKYSSKEGYTPKLSRLGTQEWEKLKAKAKTTIKDIARDLIQLYARRKHEKGFAFAKDTCWQKELEASFIYEDTPDQATATRDVKQDMESENPMDRLICGDVGYGKTEVAIRAAFKAVMDGKQVALLAPTTILTQQHYNTFRDRLSPYAVNIAVLSRFKSKNEQQEIIEKLKEGKVDIVIGTHRLLSKDVAFKDLGLLIIDEEHRFGVAAKEKLRQFKATVDTLTLTATPIPRTLHFSLMGARDLSIIETPPRNRKPIITEISEFNPELIHDAIMKEIERGGQVYFVHDRVVTIDSMTDYLQRHIPNAKFCVAHGQMKSSQLEKVMMDFMERKADVLVCTKIIESGLDLPNVNTIIINRADKFGLAELYQLRGRVGRSNQQAYAYLLTPPITSLGREAMKRLQALEEFTELGSGFNLAMRDMEIRGTGNILGAEQTGFIYSMGFELYCKILDEAVTELKSSEFSSVFRKDKKSKEIETLVEIDMDAYIPEYYIEKDSERFDIYQRLYKSRSEKDIYEIREELKDRFGQLPQEVSNLLSAVELRLLGSQLGFSKITLTDTTIICEVAAPDGSYRNTKFELLMSKLSAWKDSLQLKQTDKGLKLIISLRSRDGQHLQQAKEILTL